MAVLSAAGLAGGAAGPQAPAGDQPAYRAEFIGRTTKAINYRYRSGATRIDFRGSQLLPGATGEARVESKRGYLEIDAEFRGLQSARTFGPEYLTYVMWAVTPEGRAQNLGEAMLNRDRSKLKVTTELQAFGLVVTAEPYFAVTQPSDVVVLENVVRPDTRGRIEEMEVNYELLRRGQYRSQEKPDELTVKLMVVDPNIPLELYQARNAVRIARWAGAEKYAGDTFNKAVDLLLEAEKYQARRRPASKPAAMMARQAVQTAEDARLLTGKRAEEERLALERKAAAEREAKAQAQAAMEAQLRAKAEADTQAAERAAAQADRAAAEADRVRREAEAAAEQARRQRAEAEQAQAAAMAELERIRQQTAEEVRKMEAARAESLAQQRAAEYEAQRARAAAEEASRLRERSERDRLELRQRLQEQLNRVLETTNTARGLIVNMADVLFDTAQFTLRPEAREKLARISGILSTQPGLKLEVEGHTDSVGGEDYNQRLSEQRAGSVRSYLVEQGIDPDAIVARGFGETRPKASNDTSAGRQQNRRVELVVSGGVLEAPPAGS